MRIENREIGVGHRPFIVGEMSANHNKDINRAFAIIDAVKTAGADAVKLQTYRPDTITLQSNRDEFRVHGGLWDGRNLSELYEEAYLPWDWHRPLFQYARETGITIFSSPFDKTAVDLLESLECPAYKIASFEAVDIPLIEYAASTGKPLIISTGMADEVEIAEAVDAARREGCTELALLHCVSAYPALPEEYNLRTIGDMAERFSVIAGLSDHTEGNLTAIASIALGASIIEKHVTIDREGGGADDAFSCEPSALRQLCQDADTVWKSLGEVVYDCANRERSNRKFRRSLYFVKSLAAGDTISADSVRSLRPGYGMAPKHYVDILGRTVNKAVDYGDPVTESVIDPPL